ncbi:PilX N-terminal domain-containing pilus assembly protein [uncultured Thiohalocapsa sp.]|uniref:pilus assembly PilX family protein n=1 Tax=uncultured Thiohalocapsa sp. TaxID=768990 RepID=UPI0025E60F9E|nr:PilX N-terminal domain-containing pilus assembly protein [uncultured Thiohalocapsa sp.]
MTDRSHDTRHNHPPKARRRERGAVLIVGLVILLVVTMIGISGQGSTVLQERLAGNMRQNNIALQAAEAGLQVGLTYIEEQNLPITATDSGTNYVWTSCSVADTQTLDNSAASDDPCTRLEAVLESWRTPPSELAAGEDYEGIEYSVLVNALNNAPASGTDVDIPGVVAQPRIYIEAREEPVSPDTQANSFGQLVTYYYTVTSVGFGANEQARAVLQSTIAKQVQQ